MSKKKRNLPANRNMPEGSQPRTPQQAPQPQAPQSAPGQQGEIRAQIQYSGPLPHPRALEAYENILPGAADRIMKMAENNSAFLIQMEKQVAEGELKYKGRSQYFALILVMTALLVAGVLGYNGQQLSASIIGGTTVVALAGIFVLGRFLPGYGEKDDKDKS